MSARKKTSKKKSAKRTSGSRKIPRKIKPKDSFIESESDDQESTGPKAKTIKTPFTFDPKRYEDFDDRFRPASELTPSTVHTTAEFVALLEKDPKIEVDARVLAYSPSTKEFKLQRYKERAQFLNAIKKADKKFKFNESKKDFLEWDDWFAGGDSGGSGAIAGSENTFDFTPLLGGPFFKQLYQYDYMRQIATCFYAWHHDPFAKFIIETVVDFVLGKGFEVESEDEKAQIQWDLFSEANKFDQYAVKFLRELLVYGEHMNWFLPPKQGQIAFKPFSPGQPEPAIIPRVRLIDPSCIWDICTQPEDIEDVLFYQWLAPTQYQTYTAPGVPTTKFIFQQIPASNVSHYKINVADNEKRGRSELFAILGYLKRLRDTVNYSVIAMLKAAAWSIDTTVKGSQEDLNNYVSAINEMGTVPPAGSEFVHTEAIERDYLANQGPSSTQTDTFSWVLSAVAAGARIPVSYFGSHLSGQGTRGSVIVATEPVAKYFEARRELVKTMIRDTHKRITGSDCKVIFPELITQDRSIKIRDTTLAEQNQFISHKRAAMIVAKELDQDDFDYDKEQKEIQAEPPPVIPPTMSSPLTSPAKTQNPMGPSSGRGGVSSGEEPKSSEVPSDQKRQIKKNDSQ